ncbi:unnamed protein product [Strongylus vulgaris]|uniref:Domain of unknown function DB domain-containing protein n=1 Tax=Strongylus vulgaris TaxID=40348 RepID=A0A3P7IRA1_STRVU|nr:unnamed protein product [Strongylus vulgaris]
MLKRDYYICFQPLIKTLEEIRLTLANALFNYCCRKSSIPVQCTSACDYDRYTSQLVSYMMSGHSECPTAALSTVHLCASRGQDQRDCCARAGIPSQCIRYCDPSTTSMQTSLRFPCLIYLDKMKGFIAV